MKSTARLRLASEHADAGAVAGNPAMELRGLEKSYVSRDGTVVRALEPISLSVPNREFVTIVGPSGCGKSTILKLLAGLIERTAGDIRLRDKSVVGPQDDIGMVFQSPVLLPWKTALENILLPAVILKLDRKAARERAHELLAMLGLSDFGQKYPNELSGGMQQRVAIGRALIHDPSILLMDEPFGALDAMTREMMNVEIRRIWKSAGKTIFFVTHSIPEAVFLGTRVLVLSSRPGRVVDDIEIDLPTDRDLDVMNSDGFGVYTRRIRNQFQTKGMIE